MSSEETSDPLLLAEAKSEKEVKKERRKSISKLFGRSGGGGEKTSNSADETGARSSPKLSRRSSRETGFQLPLDTMDKAIAGMTNDKNPSKQELALMILGTRQDLEKKINLNDGHLYEQDTKIDRMTKQVDALMKNSAMTSQLLIDLHTWQQEQRYRPGGGGSDTGYASPTVKLLEDQPAEPSCLDALIFWRDS